MENLFAYDLPATNLTEPQVFFTIDCNPSSLLPVWMFNEKLEMNPDGAVGWLHVPLRLCHPWKLPPTMRLDHLVAFEQIGPLESVVFAGVRAGVFLTINQLKLLHTNLMFPLPPEGSGKTKNFIKRDYASSLIKFLFPEASDKERTSMFYGIMGRSWRHLDSEKTSRHCADILSAFNGLEKTDQVEFTELAAVATDEVLLQERRVYKGRVETFKKSTKQHSTPLVLRDLHPGIQGCRITRHPVMKRFQGFYTTYDGSGSRVPLSNF